jgi:hypothetical protein
MALPPGGVPEWPKGTGCKPVGSAFRGSNPLSPTFRMPRFSKGRQQRKDALEWLSALLAQLVEHLHGKEGVDGSSPSEGSLRYKNRPQMGGFLLPYSTPKSTSLSRRGSVLFEVRINPAKTPRSSGLATKTCQVVRSGDRFWGQNWSSSSLARQRCGVQPPTSPALNDQVRGQAEWPEVQRAQLDRAGQLGNAAVARRSAAAVRATRAGSAEPRAAAVVIVPGTRRNSCFATPSGSAKPASAAVRRK